VLGCSIQGVKKAQDVGGWKEIIPYISGGEANQNLDREIETDHNGIKSINTA